MSYPETCCYCGARLPREALIQLRGAWKCSDAAACAARASGDVETDDGEGLAERYDEFEAASPMRKRQLEAAGVTGRTSMVARRRES